MNHRPRGQRSLANILVGGSQERRREDEMSKRGATFQLSKEGKFNGDGQPPDGGGSERDENDAPTRATAAQLAKRK